MTTQRQSRRRGYTLLGSHPDPDAFNPFAPDLEGALREAYAYITQPLVIRSDGTATYSTRHYGQIVTMMRRALAPH